MGHLDKVLLIKIVITLVAWAIPLLFMPAAVFNVLGFPEPEPIVFFRLLGMAYVALVVGYALGLSKVHGRKYPEQAVWVGIVSNGGATLVLIAAAILQSWATWGVFAQLYMWFSLVSVALITVGLIVEGPVRRARRNRHDRPPSDLIA